MRDWLLKFAILLFPFDVAVRRIQLDQAEWLRATNKLRRWIFFWKGTPRTKEADESLSALLARRGQVRSQRTAPAPNPALFEPEKPVQTQTPSPPTAPVPGSTPTPVPGEKPPGQGQVSTTGRLLDAKRRAKKRTDRE